jgi:hypothetical protein
LGPSRAAAPARSLAARQRDRGRSWWRRRSRSWWRPPSPAPPEPQRRRITIPAVVGQLRPQTVLIRPPPPRQTFRKNWPPSWGRPFHVQPGPTNAIFQCPSHRGQFVKVGETASASPGGRGTAQTRCPVDSAALSDHRMAEFEYRFNRRYDLEIMIPRLAFVALRTPPMPYRLLKLADVAG